MRNTQIRRPTLPWWAVQQVLSRTPRIWVTEHAKVVCAFAWTLTIRPIPQPPLALPQAAATPSQSIGNPEAKVGTLK
jgi:hypothetical protein